MRSAQQPQPGRRRVALRVNCGQLDPGRLALLSGRFDSTVGAVDDLRQPGTTGHGRHGATHDQSLRPTSEMRRSRRLRRRETPTRPNVERSLECPAVALASRTLTGPRTCPRREPSAHPTRWPALRINNPMRRSLRVRRQRSRRASEHRGRLDRLAFAIETTPVRPAVATLMREHPR
jgi:hypothetical protein